MKKLIELLKQFDIKNGRQYPEYKIEKGIVYKVYHNPFEGDEYIDWTLNIISKQFGFIGRLVENDKIDLNKVKGKILLERDLYDRILYWYEETDFLIMMLSIQDNPIEFLVSILK